MFSLSFKLHNPYSNKFEHAVTKNGILTQNKAWEFNIYRTATIFSNRLEFTMNRDHAGLRLEIGLLGYEVEFQIYDVRHWNYEKKEWKTYEETLR